MQGRTFHSPSLVKTYFSKSPRFQSFLIRRPDRISSITPIARNRYYSLQRILDLVDGKPIYQTCQGHTLHPTPPASHIPSAGSSAFRMSLRVFLNSKHARRRQQHEGGRGKGKTKKREREGNAPNGAGRRRFASMRYNERWASGVIIPPILPASIPIDPRTSSPEPARCCGPLGPSLSLSLLPPYLSPPWLLSSSRFAHYERTRCSSLPRRSQIIAS